MTWTQYTQCTTTAMHYHAAITHPVPGHRALSTQLAGIEKPPQRLCKVPSSYTFMLYLYATPYASLAVFQGWKVEHLANIGLMVPVLILQLFIHQACFVQF